MKIFSTLLLACGISFACNAQYTALSAAGDGGFETGTTFAANNWTSVAPPAVPINQWFVGSATPPFAPARCAYITNNAGVTYAYTNTTSRTAHIYHDVTIPAGSVSITLKFQWKGSGQTGFDQLLVYTAPTTVIPVANVPVSPSTVLTGATLVWTQPSLSGAYTLATVSLPATLAGTTFRLIFTWQNDASLGTSPGAAVDDISVTYNCGAPPAITGSPTACVGLTTALGDAMAGGTWVSSNLTVGTISTTGVVTGIAAGTTTISYTTTCASPTTRVVSVLADPGTITGPSNVCAGYTITLANTSLGGGWSSSTTSVGTVNSVSGVVTGISAGTTIISYSNGCGAPSMKLITVNPIPPAIGGQDTVCQAGTMTLSNAMTGGTWSSTPITVATASTSGPGTGLISGVAVGAATIVYTSAAGCPISKVVSVSPLPSPIVGNTPVCVSLTISLSDAYPGGTWNSATPGIASVNSSGVVTGNTGGTTIISYSNGCGPRTVVVSVSPLPLPIVGSNKVCVGATTTFANSIIGGTWSSSAPTVATVLTGSGIITGIMAGAASIITYTMPGNCIITKDINVVGLPGSITGPLEVCPGNTIILHSDTTGGTWTSLSPSSATIGSSSGVVTGVAADTAVIRYTSALGCVVYTTITINPLPPAIHGATTGYCASDVDTLFDAVPGGTWSSLSPTIATITGATGIMTTISGGTATIKYTLPTTCSITGTFAVHSAPTPVVTLDTFVNTFKTDTGYSSYQWYHSILGEIVGATIYKTAALYNGNYYVVVSDGLGCFGQSAPKAYTVGIGVKNVHSENGVRVYPNPVSDVLVIAANEAVRAVISTIDGKTIIDKANAKTIDVSALPSGIYVLSLYNEMGLKIGVDKLTKQ